MPWNVVGNAIGAQASIINTKQTNEMNYKIAKETNEANRKMVELQNEAAAAESEKAYQRSKAGNQVALMRAAGMSRAGAINALHGGGSYTPAPVNVSQDSAPQMQTADVSSLANMGQTLSAIFERKHQEKMLNKQLQAQKEENEAQRDSNERIAQLQADTTNRNADNRLEFDKEQFDKLSPYQIRQINATIGKISAEAKLTQTQEKDLAYRVAEYQSEEYKSVRDAQKLLEGLQADFDYKITNKSFNDYLNENYDYKDGEYVPKQWHSNANKVQQGARTIWNTIFEILPINLLLEALGGTVENVKAIKALSKVK